MSRVSNFIRDLHPGCMWGKQRPAEARSQSASMLGAEADDCDKVFKLPKRHCNCKLVLQLESQKYCISYQEGRHLFLRATLQEGFTSESSSLTACVSISKLSSRASAKHFREVWSSAHHCGPLWLPCKSMARFPLVSVGWERVPGWYFLGLETVWQTPSTCPSWLHYHPKPNILGKQKE